MILACNLAQVSILDENSFSNFDQLKMVYLVGILIPINAGLLHVTGNKNIGQ